MNQAVYRGRIKGTANLSIGSLIGFLETWALSASPTISVGQESFSVDATCLLSMDSPDAPDCFVITNSDATTTTAAETTAAATTQTTTATPSTSPATRSTAIPALTEQQSSRISSGEAGGLVIGVIIIVLLLVFVILLLLVLIRSFGWHHQTIK